MFFRAKKTPPEAHLILDKEATLGDKKWSREMPACISRLPRPMEPFTNDVWSSSGCAVRLPLSSHRVLIFSLWIYNSGNFYSQISYNTLLSLHADVVWELFHWGQFFLGLPPPSLSEPGKHWSPLSFSSLRFHMSLLYNWVRCSAV